MGLGCGATMVKYLLFLMNFTFFVCGAAILGVSIWIQVDDSASDYLDIIGEANGNPALEAGLYILTAVGAFIFLVGFLGCCGACKESSCMLCLYAILVSLILVLQIAAAIVAIVFKGDLDSTLEDGMSEQVNGHVTADIEDATTKLYFRTQFELKCCGGANFEDYKNSAYANDTTRPTNQIVPVTCCKQADDSKWDSPVAEDLTNCMDEAASFNYDPDYDYQDLYAHGCYEGLKDWMSDKSTIVIGVAFGLAAFQVLCVIFACCVRSAIQKREGYE